MKSHPFPLMVAVAVCGWAPAAPVPKEKPREGLIGVVKDGEVLLLTPDGEVATRITPKKKDTWPPSTTAHPAPTATGFPVAMLAPVEIVESVKGKPNYTGCGVWLLSGPGDAVGKRVDVGEHRLQGQLLWSRGGKHLFVQCFLPADELKANVVKYGTCGVGKYLIVDPATGKTTDAAIPAEHKLIGETADGKLLCDGWWPVATANAVGGRLRGAEHPLFIVPADGKKAEAVKPLPARLDALDLAPDGRTLLCQGYVPKSLSDTFETFDVVSGETAVIEVADLKGRNVRAAHSGCWSPDGKRMVIGFGEQDEKGRQVGGWKLMACNADGANCKELLNANGQWAIKGVWR